LGVVLRNNVGGDIFQLILPQKSIFGTGDVDHMPFLQYAKYVASSGYNLNMLATRLTFDTDSDFPKLVFSNSEFLDKPTYQLALAQGQTPVAINAGKMNFTKKAETAAIPKLVAPAGSAAAEAKTDEAIPEPTVRVEKKKVVSEPKPKQNLAAMVDDWGDDDK
jgi:hypothetical protein